MSLIYEIHPFINQDGQIIQYPSKRRKKLMILLYLAEKLPKDTPMSEVEINAQIRLWFLPSDYVTIRRELVDHGCIQRDPACRVYLVPGQQPSLADLEKMYPS